MLDNRGKRFFEVEFTSRESCGLSVTNISSAMVEKAAILGFMG